MKHASFFGFLTILGLCAAACSGGTNPASPTSIVPSSSRDFYGGTLTTMGAVPNTIILPTLGKVEATLLTLTTVTNTLQTFPVALSIGTLDGVNCVATTTVNAVPALKAQLSTTLPAGTYCVNLADIGNVTEDVTFVLRVVQNPTTSATGNVTESFSSNIALGGAASRSFTMYVGGTVTTTLQSLGSSANVGLGIGVAGVSSDLCTLTMMVTGPAGTQISIPADPSTYCVKVIDLGNLVTGTTPFTVSIFHPS